MYKILWNTTVSPNTLATLYTVPTGKMCEVSLVSVATKAWNPEWQLVQVHVVPNWQWADLNNLLQKRQLQKLSERWDFTWVKMNEGDAIVVKSNMDNVAFMAFGDELPNDRDDKIDDVLSAIRGAIHGGVVHTDTVVNCNCA